MNILYLAHRIPYPPDKGDKIRSFNQIKYLSQKNDIYLGTTLDNRSDQVFAEQLGRYCKDIHTVYFNRNISVIKNIFNKTPFSVFYFYHKSLQNYVDKILIEVEFDVVICFCSSMAEYVFWTPSFRNKETNSIKFIMDYVDLDSDKWRQYAKYARFPLNLLYKIEMNRLLDYEILINQTFNSSVFVSEREVGVFRRKLPQVKNLHVISNGVDYDYFFFKNKCDKKKSLPHVSLLISCYNEDLVIQEKIENSLNIDYPKEKLEIIVISDSSTDRTDEIVRQYKDRGVRLLRQDKRSGKTSGLNLAMLQVKSDFVVFSDANAMYSPDAILRLIHRFYDKTVGYVVGYAKYRDIESTSASKSENAYWQYEIFMKKMESDLHSVVGGDGAIYAIRRELYEELLVTDINDFVNPLQIILKGYRGVFEPTAICWENAAGSFNKEFLRKVRIVNRSFSGLMRMREVTNPYRTGLFSLEIVSHKLLRWFSPVFLFIFIISSLLLSIFRVTIFQWGSIGILLLLLLSYIGFLLSGRNKSSKIFYFPYYFSSVSIASCVGIYKSFKGDIQTTWNPDRAKEYGEEKTHSKINWLFHVLAVIFCAFLFHIIKDLLVAK